MPKNWFPGQPHWPLPRRTLPAAHTHAATLAAPATVVVVWVGQREHAVALVAPISELKVPELHSIAWPKLHHEPAGQRRQTSLLLPPSCLEDVPGGQITSAGLPTLQ
mmetsp:Transcript_88870/g.267314  ORF Transcript_88870/g.267314 Transcript_88870/m.267314 type:complete len:107 (-) Transcript_88870:231-551(-)